MKTTEPIYKELTLNSRNLIVPREAYQRELNLARVRKIAAEFDEHIANEPKVSCRNGRYYVFDGQHTIEARKQRNHGQDLPILCKVYYGLTESDEAMLFAQQTGFSSILTAGARIRALIYAGDPKAISFQKITESVGFQLDYTQSRAQKRLACIGTAFDEFEKIGEIQGSTYDPDGSLGRRSGFLKSRSGPGHDPLYRLLLRGIRPQANDPQASPVSGN